MNLLKIDDWIFIRYSNIYSLGIIWLYYEVILMEKFWEWWNQSFSFFFFRVLKYNFTWYYFFFFSRVIHRNLTDIKIFLYLVKRIGRKANEILTVDFAPLNFAEINCIVYIYIIHYVLRIRKILLKTEAW